VGDDTDTAVSAISGTIEIELDDYGAPTSITLHDFIIVLESDPELNFDYGLAGSADATLIDAMAMYATPGLPTGPVPVAGTAFDFPGVPTVLSGTADASYDFLFVGADTVTIDLADQGVVATPIAGDVTSDGQAVTLSGELDIDVQQNVVPDVADLTLTGTATLVATGDAPAPSGCNDADLAEPFGVLDLGDIAAFVTAFGAQDPAADIAPPAGVWDLNDLGAFVTAFTAGCP
jgi:hypothetical protein